MELIITNREEFDNRPLLPLDIKEKWLEALRSGNYEKGKGYLCKTNKYCCLGVLCEIQERPKELEEYGQHIRFDKSVKILSVLNPLYKLLESGWIFKGFVIKEINEKYKNIEIINLAMINDNSETFDDVIEVIEKYF